MKCTWTYELEMDFADIDLADVREARTLRQAAERALARRSPLDSISHRRRISVEFGSDDPDQEGAPDLLLAYVELLRAEAEKAGQVPDGRRAISLAREINTPVSYSLLAHALKRVKAEWRKR